MAVRKTSGRYRLVILSNGRHRTINVSCDTVTGRILPPSSKKSGTDLAVLDLYILENIEDEKDLIRTLKRLGYLVKDGDVPKFAYQHKGVTNYLELIYQSEELSTLAQICHQYKKRFSNYGAKNRISPKQIRRLISGEISREEEWKLFYKDMIESVHWPDFYDYLQKNPILGERALGYIDDYLNNEDAKDKDAFRSAEYYLIDTFTAYKPIRGMIVCKQNYLKTIQAALVQQEQLMIPKKVNPFTQIDPFSLLSEIQLAHLEDHESFNRMSRSEQEDVILDALGITRRQIPLDEEGTAFETVQIPWYEKVLMELTEAQINYLESHPNFEQLSYLDKIRMVDSLFTGKSYQKKK